MRNFGFFDRLFWKIFLALLERFSKKEIFGHMSPVRNIFNCAVGSGFFIVKEGCEKSVVSGQMPAQPKGKNYLVNLTISGNDSEPDNSNNTEIVDLSSLG